MTSRSLLAIDDDPDICEVIAGAAAAKGLPCITTTDPAAFLNAINPATSLILVDLRMPNIDGIELLRQLGDRQCKASIVLISGVGSRILETARELAHAHGLPDVRHLQKPFRIAELEAIIESHMLAAPTPVASPKEKSAVDDGELREAVDSDQFVLHYQPQIEIATGALAGVEALVRWQHPSQGMIGPDRFIGRAEELGLIDQLSWLVYRRGFTEIGEFAHAGHAVPTLSLNVSAHSLGDLTFPDRMARLIAEHGIAPETITLEITESELFQDLTRSLDVLTRLRMKHMQLSIDDFGTGYSMMQRLRNVPATELKVDKSFVQNMIDTPSDRVVVRKTIEIGHELGMKVVAEGVETQEQLDYLRANGCDIAQGYLLSRPIPAAELLRWIAGRDSQFPRGREVAVAHG